MIDVQQSHCNPEGCRRSSEGSFWYFWIGNGTDLQFLIVAGVVDLVVVSSTRDTDANLLRHVPRLIAGVTCVCDATRQRATINDLLNFSSVKLTQQATWRA
eukprot:724497-Amphidinium_carterae.1